MTRFDITLKSIIRSMRTRFLQSLAIEGDYSEVSPNFPDTLERRVDFVARVKAGRKRAYLAQV